MPDNADPMRRQGDMIVASLRETTLQRVRCFLAGRC